MEKNYQTSTFSISQALTGLLVIFIIGVGIYAIYPKPQQPIGGQKDEHGCLVAAGYSWCSARQECERSWERYCTAAPPKVASFNCNAGKTITATFYPTDDKYVDLVLSEGKELSVPHATSASGARYTNKEESFVFWNKGNTAFITENATTTYSNCVTQVQ